jgi:hypothetical protein
MLIYNEEKQTITFLDSTFKIDNFNEINLKLEILNHISYQYINLKIPIKIFKIIYGNICVACKLNNIKMLDQNHICEDDDEFNSFHSFPFETNGIEHYYSQINITKYDKMVDNFKILNIKYKKNNILFSNYDNCII